MKRYLLLIAGLLLGVSPMMASTVINPYVDPRDIANLKISTASLQSQVDGLKISTASLQIQLNTYKTKVALDTTTIAENVQLRIASNTASIGIAPYNANGKSKMIADYVLTGTNDDVIVNAAIKQLPVGGQITIYEGDMSVKSCIWLNVSSITIIGLNTRIFVPANTGIPSQYGVFTTTGIICNCKISGFNIDANRTATGNTSVAGIMFGNSATDVITNCKVIDNTVSNAVQSIKIFYASECYIEHNNCYNSGSNGMYFYKSKKCKLVDNICINATNNAFVLQNSESCTISKCQAYNCGGANDAGALGITLSSSTITDCIFYNCYYGTRLYSSCISNTICNNVCTGGYFGITLENIDTQSYYNSIGNNACNSNVNYGFYVNCASNTYTGNNAWNNGIANFSSVDIQHGGCNSWNRDISFIEDDITNLTTKVAADTTTINTALGVSTGAFVKQDKNNGGNSSVTVDSISTTGDAFIGDDLFADNGYFADGTYPVLQVQRTGVASNALWSTIFCQAQKSEAGDGTGAAALFGFTDNGGTFNSGLIGFVRSQSSDFKGSFVVKTNNGQISDNFIEQMVIDSSGIASVNGTITSRSSCTIQGDCGVTGTIVNTALQNLYLSTGALQGEIKINAGGGTVPSWNGTNAEKRDYPCNVSQTTCTYWVQSFSPSVTNYIYATFTVPEDMDTARSVDFYVHWESSDSTVANSVVWQVEISTAVGRGHTAQVKTFGGFNAPSVAYDVTQSTLTAQTFTNLINKNLIMLRLSRQYGNAFDTLASYADLRYLVIYYKKR